MIEARGCHKYARENYVTLTCLTAFWLPSHCFCPAEMMRSKTH